MCRQDTRCVQEAIAAEESLSIYCKPVELYNILQRRALRSPSFLQRCLHYKIEAKRKRRLRNGNVIFNYQYYNNSLQKTEATVDFCCPFCLVRCASYKGLRSHLSSSHDLFNFEFWVTEEFQAVNVSVKTDIWGSEIVADEVDPRLQTFFFCSKPHKRRRLNNQVQNANHVHLYDSPEASWRGSSADCLEKDSCICLPITTSQIDDVPAEDFILQNCETDGGPNKEADKIPFSANHLQSAGRKFESTGPENVLASECTDATGVRTVADLGYDASESAQQVSASNTLSAMLQGAKTRKLSVERTDPKNVVLLQKRQFYHSHRAQPMELEQVLSDRDSEDEVDDDDITDFEDRRMLDDFVDVTKDEKHLMHLWNSFVRKQRVLADGHIPWACEAFLTLHGRDLIRAPTLIWCWRLFMIKLWNHGLLDGRTMNNCNIILERYRSESADPEKS